MTIYYKDEFGVDVYLVNTCQNCEKKLLPYKFKQYFIKNENEEILCLAVRCLHPDCLKVPDYYELIE